MHQKVTLRHGHAEHVEVMYYPDGQHNVKLDLEYFNDRKTPIDIRCSIRNMAELEILLALVAAFRANDFIVAEINFVYLFGTRSDRMFEPGMCNYFRDVLAPIINSLNCRMRFLQPHGRSGWYIDTNDFYGDKWIRVDHEILKAKSKICLAGDKSAADLLSSVNGSWGDDQWHFDKKRSEEGIKVYLKNEWRARIKSAEEDTILIVDDLCDGGATFIAEAKYLKEFFPEKKLQLFVYHGIFSRGFSELSQYFERIYCTNSYMDYKQEFVPNMRQIKVI